MKDRKTVSLFLYIPEKHVIVLGVRAPTQSHPHLLQATCHGAIEKDEDHGDAIERELLEETTLGLPDIGALTFLGELGAGHKVHEECSYYLASITEANAKKIRPTAEVGHFRFITKDALREVVVFSEAEKKKLDVSVHSIMFDDELEALREAFALLEEHKWNPVGS
ncbi:MAG: NUDIX domain-containing protein [bacterium]|nr:NUDIX domain-containing protein [bacterium]